VPPRPDRTFGERSSRGYLTSSPVTARPMIIRWISDVPSKMVKLSDVVKREQRLCG
jgi:hypothetical protein